MANVRLGLSRGDYNSHSVETFHCLFKDENFTDVTLVCRDQQTIKGHKVILSSCSQFFKKLLLENPHPSPLIYLNLKYDHLYSIVRFIYLGECEIEQSDLEYFLETAKDFTIDGLASEKGSEGSVLNQKLFQSNVLKDIESRQNIITMNCAYLPEENVQSVEETTDSLSDFNTDTIKEETVLIDNILSEDMQQDSIEKVENNLECNECGIVEFCKAALIVHKRKRHGTQITSTTETDVNDVANKDLSMRTVRDRKREFSKFQNNILMKTGKSLTQIMSETDGKELIQNLLFDFFSNFRTQDGKIPSLNYVSTIRSSINNQLIEEHNLDLTNRESFPEFHRRWREIASQFKGMECKECGKEFSDTRTLEYHQRKQHNEISQFECGKCERRFSRAWRLKAHMKTHMNIIE